MLIQFSPNLLLYSIILIACINVVTPFASREYTRLRSYIMVISSIFFFVNILILDFAFLQNMEATITLFSVGKYVFAFHIETLGMVFLNLLGLLWFIAQAYTDQFLKINNIKHSSNFLFFLNCAMLMGICVALSANLFSMFITYELLTLCTIPLIIHVRGQEVNKALGKYLTILMTTSLALFLPATLIVYTNVGHGNFTEYGILGAHFNNQEAIMLLLLFMFGISKAAIFPVHSWLPAAMVAVYPVSALLHAVVVVKTGIFCLCKIFLYIFGFDYLQLLFTSYNWLVLIPAVGIIYSSVKAMQSDYLKSILAFSTISQLNLSLLSLCLFTPRGLIGAVMHMVSHSFTKISLFYIMGAFYSSFAVQKLDDLRGIYTRMPKLSVMFLIAMASLVGIPPLAGFVSKLYILFAASEAQNIAVIAVLALSTIMTASYGIKMVLAVFESGAGKQQHCHPTVPKVIDGTIVLCVALSALFFVISDGIGLFLLFV